MSGSPFGRASPCARSPRCDACRIAPDAEILVLLSTLRRPDAMKERGLAPGGFPSDARGAHIPNREGGPGERSIRRHAVRRDRLAPAPVGGQPDGPAW